MPDLHLPRFTLEKYINAYCNIKTNTGAYFFGGYRKICSVFPPDSVYHVQNTTTTSVSEKYRQKMCCIENTDRLLLRENQKYCRSAVEVVVDTMQFFLRYHTQFCVSYEMTSKKRRVQCGKWPSDFFQNTVSLLHVLYSKKIGYFSSASKISTKMSIGSASCASAPDRKRKKRSINVTFFAHSKIWLLFVVSKYFYN